MALHAGGGRTLVEATLRTGVTHQVRVHLALLGYPVLGDALYGGPEADLAPAGMLCTPARWCPQRRLGDLPTWESALPADLAAIAPR